MKITGGLGVSLCGPEGRRVGFGNDLLGGLRWKNRPDEPHCPCWGKHGTLQCHHSDTVLSLGGSCLACILYYQHIGSLFIAD